uniref:Ribonuclease A-domain domain-containing protein n=1 Tax=Leptobrachium leishanense TaxID=445787 RepID=A0A8C5QRX7_9ANUR
YLDLNLSTGSVITLVMLLQITVLSQCQNLNSFLEKHVVSENADITVTDIIRNRNIRSGNNCKKKNTFIHDTNGLRVKELCSKLAEKKDVKSEFCLPLTHGILQNNSAKPPDCIYVQKVIFGKIHITCENKEPVHLIALSKPSSRSNGSSIHRTLNSSEKLPKCPAVRCFHSAVLFR